jgi:hypothetical protein
MAGPIHELSGEQYHVLYEVIRKGEALGANGQEVLAAVETGITEDHLHNRNTATRSNPAVGWRQEEPSYGSVADRLNLDKSIPNFYREVRALRPWRGTAGQLAQAVQRSAYPKRYDENAALARKLISEFGANKLKPGEVFGPEPGKPGVLINPTVVGSGDPADHSPKTRASGDKLGKAGSQFQGHARAMRNLAARTLSTKG